MDSARGQTSFLRTVFAQHPNFMRSLQYRGKPTSLFKVAKELGPKINAYYNVIAPGLRLTVATDGLERDYNPQKILELKENLRGRFERLKRQGYEQDEDKDIRAQFFELIESSKKLLNENDGQRKRIQFLLDFVVLSPFLYDSEGSPLLIDVVSSEIAELYGDDLENLYKDIFNNHLKSMLFQNVPDGNNGFVLQIKSRFEKNFVESQLEPSLVLESRNSQAHQVSLEEVPKLVALFRGAFGHDCSMVSVPMYTLHPKVRTFWLRDGVNFSQQPKGYILVVEVQHEGRTRPLILTANGSGLSEADVRAAALGVNSLYGNESTVLVSNAPQLVNSDLVRGALWYQETERSSKVKVRFPSGWDKISDSWKTRNRLNDFYAKSVLKENVIEIRLKPDEQKQIHEARQLPPGSIYQEPRDLSQISLFDKGTLASVFPSARRVLKLTPDQYSSAKAFTKLQWSENGVLDPEEIYFWAKQLEVPITKLLMSLNMEERITVYAILKDRDPNSVNTKEMKLIVESIKSYLIERASRLNSSVPWEQESLWHLIKALGFHQEMWATVFLNAPWVTLKTNGLRRKILSDMFTRKVMFGPEGKDLFEQATKALGRESVLIYYLREIPLDRNVWPDHLWKWAVITSSLPILPYSKSPRGYDEGDINEGILQLNRFFDTQMRYKKPPYWLIADLLSSLPKNYIWEKDPESYANMVYEAKISQIVGWLSTYMDTVNLEDARALAQALLKTFVQNPKLHENFRTSERLFVSLKKLGARFKGQSKEIDELKGMVSGSRSKDCEPLLE